MFAALHVSVAVKHSVLADPDPGRNLNPDPDYELGQLPTKASKMLVKGIFRIIIL
jgi:hypothetical protein